MESAGVDRRLVVPEIERLFRRIDAITGRAMQIEVDVDLMLLADFDDVIDVFQFCVPYFEPVAGFSPTEIRKRQAGEIEAPIREHFVIAFAKRWIISVAAFDAFFGQI